MGISHDKYTISEGNLGGEIFDLRYENDITNLRLFRWDTDWRYRRFQNRKETCYTQKTVINIF